MAKIPRIAKGDRPSGVPSELPSIASTVIPFQIGAAAVESAFEDISEAERGEALRLRNALEAKQAIVNQVTASRRAGDFEESVRDFSESLKQTHFENPEAALPALQTRARRLADIVRKAAPNTTVGLALARSTEGRINSAMREMHSWVQVRQTQKAKNDLGIIVNRATAGAESLGSVQALNDYLESKDAELRSTFENVHGGEAGKRIQAMKTDATRAWVLSASERDPIAILQALDAKSGPLVDHLDTSERVALKKATRSAFEGFGKIRETQILKSGVAQNRSIFESFLEGSLNGGTLFAAQRSNAEAQKAVRVDPRYDDKQKENQLKLLNEQARFYQALESARRRQLPFDAEDDIGTVTSLQQRFAGIFQRNKGSKGSELVDLLKFQSDLAAAFNDKKISGT